MRPFLLSVVLLFLSSSSPASAFDVNLSAYGEHAAGYIGYGALLQLRVPLDRFAGSGVARSPELSRFASPVLHGGLGEFAEQPDEATFANVPLVAEDGLSQDAASDEGAPASAPYATPRVRAPVELPRASSARVPSTPSAASPPATHHVSDETAATFPERLRVSPAFVRKLIAASLGEFDRTQRRLAGVESRARTSAWLPDLRLRGGRNVDQTLRLSPTLDDPDRWQLTGGADLRLEAQLHWRFSRLVFADEELPVERARQSAAQRRARRVDEVLSWLFKWQEALMRAADPLSEPQQQLAAQLDELQARTALDVLSNGWFSRHLAP